MSKIKTTNSYWQWISMIFALFLSGCGCNATQEGCWFIGHPFRGKTTTERDIRFEPNGSACTLNTDDFPQFPKCSPDAGT